MADKLDGLQGDGSQGTTKKQQRNDTQEQSPEDSQQRDEFKDNLGEGSSQRKEQDCDQLSEDELDMLCNRLAELDRKAEDKNQELKQYVQRSDILIRQIMLRTGDPQQDDDDQQNTDRSPPKASPQRETHPQPEASQQQLQGRIQKFTEATKQKFPGLMDFYQKYEDQLEYFEGKGVSESGDLDKVALAAAAVREGELLKQNSGDRRSKTLTAWKVTTMVYFFLETCLTSFTERQLLEEHNSKEIKKWLDVLQSWGDVVDNLEGSMASFREKVEGTETLVNKCHALLRQLKLELCNCIVKLTIAKRL